METCGKGEYPGLSYETDVLVIGAGAAGIRAAVAARDCGADVLVVSSRQVGQGGSTFYPLSLPWGIVYAEEGAVDRSGFLKEIETAGMGLGNPALTGIMVERSWSAYAELRRWGIEFEDLASADDVPCFGSRPRGARLRDPVAAARRFSAQLACRGIKTVADGRVFDLIVEDGTCRGAAGVNSAGKAFVVTARSVVLATGGAVGLWQEGFSRGDTMGDGYAMAARAGARLVNLEFVQFIPGTVAPVRGINFHHKTLALQPVISGPDGNDSLLPFLPKDVSEETCLASRSLHGPFSCEDESRFFDFAAYAAGPDGLALAYRKDSLRNGVADNWRSLLASVGVDPRTDQLRIYPFAQAFNGGVSIDERCQTDIEGLFACGECAGGVHGANRMGGTAILSALVFGAIAGESAANHAKGCMAGRLLPSVFPRPCPSTPSAKELEQVIRKTLQGSASIIRNADGLERGLKLLEEGEARLSGGGTGRSGVNAVDAFVHNECTTARLIMASMLARRESLGPHYRSDFPIQGVREGVRDHGRRSSIRMKQDGSLVIEAI